MIRFGTDNIFGLTLGKILNILTIELPEDNKIALAMDTTLKSVFKRLFYPNFMWKFMRFLSIGSEKSLKKSLHILNNYITEALDERVSRTKTSNSNTDDLLLAFMKKLEANGHILQRTAIKSTILDILLAGRDSVATCISWFFWLVMNNPHVEKKIVDEIIVVLRKTRVEDMTGSKLLGEDTQKWMEEPLSYEEINSLVYLHATLLETLRLYPSVPRIVRYAISDDILADGTYVPAGSDIILSIYSVGRMKSVWGEDCLEFIPER
ncbi:cytochrome P450 86A1-like [Lycium barbarum]|uniref:cytochrome P450 86A1-like n=1 Tax=Lycium barbarum TaxID=112863 RepID=UPI00293E8E38|nr:cytochrome P450 86A1-like [Lycium barbarum]